MKSRPRKDLMPTLAYELLPETDRTEFWVPKFQNSLETSIFNKVINQELPVKEIWGDKSNNAGKVYYRNTGVRYYFVFTNSLPKYPSSTQEKKFIKRGYNPIIMVALLSSSIFWWWYTIRGDCWHLTKLDIQSFRVNKKIFDDKNLLTLGQGYLEKNSSFKEERRNGKTIKTQEFKIQKSKPIINKIDEVLSRYYDFTPEELDFIQSYDKFRVGDETNDE